MRGRAQVPFAFPFGRPVIRSAATTVVCGVAGGVVFRAICWCLVLQSTFAWLR